mgnify:CR=1 FL=1
MSENEINDATQAPVLETFNQVVEEKSENTVEKFKAQLIQSIEINDRLIAELEKKEKEVSIFKELQTNMELLVGEKDRIITQLQESIQTVQLSKFNERRDQVLRKWISKFNISTEQATSVQKMLSKMTSEDELVDVERLLDVAVIKKVSEPVPLTQTSTFLDNASAPSQVRPIETMSAGERVDMLWNKIEQLKGVQR